MADEEERLDPQQAEARLAEELKQLHRESYGKGAKTARVHILDDMVVALLDDIELLPNEQFMIESGRQEVVLSIRSEYQQVIESTFSAAVERATGRRVVSFTSNTKIDLGVPYMVEIFRLGPEHPSELQEPDTE